MDKHPPNATQHNTEIHENIKHWERKPRLREEYARFYREIAAQLKGIPDAPVLECGSGIGNLKSALPQAITSDLFPNPWLDRQENVYALSYSDHSLGAVVLFDVFHHLQYPGTALHELHRALQPRGRVVIFEPAAGLLGLVAFGLFHHEPLALSSAISWDAPINFAPGATIYYAAQGNAWRIFGKKSACICLKELGWNLREVRYFPALPWLLTGGFRGPTFWLPSFIVKGIDKVLSLAPKFFASRMIIVLERKQCP